MLTQYKNISNILTVYLIMNQYMQITHSLPAFIVNFIVSQVHTSSGSDQSKSQMRPWSGTSNGLSSSDIWKK